MVDIAVELPPDIISVVDYGLGGPTAMLARSLGGRLVVQEGAEVRYCRRCGTQVRVWRWAQNPPDAYGETDEGRAFWAKLVWLEGPCQTCWIERDRDGYFAHLRDRSRLRERHEKLLARRQGDGREVKHYIPKEEAYGD